MRALIRGILGDPRVRNRIVVLCEGDLPADLERRKLSPQSYRELRVKPDATFYKSCTPRAWPQRRLPIPEFFNCGGRSQVIQAFEALSSARERQSYVDVDKLYALVDLDIQAERLPLDGYPWTTTEDVHADLYEDGNVRANVDARHRIWVTALIHKEAFFVLPDAAAALATHPLAPYFDGRPLDLRALHKAAARSLVSDKDIESNLPCVLARLDRFGMRTQLDCSGADAVMNSWLSKSSEEGADYNALVRGLLAVAKVKPLWSQVVPDPDQKSTMRAEVYRDQLAGGVAKHIAEADPREHPIAGFFAWLEARHSITLA